MDALTRSAQHVQHLHCTIDEAITVPENAVAVEHPSVVLGEQGGVVWRGGEPEGHGGMESINSGFCRDWTLHTHVRFLKKTADSYLQQN